MAMITAPEPRNNSALKKRMGKEVEHGRAIGADASGEEHVTELRTGGISYDTLDIVLQQADGGGEERCHRTDNSHHRRSVWRIFINHRTTANEENASGHHGRRVNKGGDRRRAFHGVGQPGVQHKLRRLAHGADEQQYGDNRQRMPVLIEEVDAQFLDRRGRDCAKGIDNSVVFHRIEYGVKLNGAEDVENRHDAKGEAEIADTVDHKGFDRRIIGGLFLEPETNEQIGGETDPFPTKE